MNFLRPIIKTLVRQRLISNTLFERAANPKVIKLPKVSFINSAIATAAYFGLVGGNSALCCLPFSFIAAKMMFVRSWVSGLKLDIIEPSSSPLENIKA